jgi:hypothetical protein
MWLPSLFVGNGLGLGYPIICSSVWLARLIHAFGTLARRRWHLEMQETLLICGSSLVVGKGKKAALQMCSEVT